MPAQFCESHYSVPSRLYSRLKTRCHAFRDISCVRDYRTQIALKIIHLARFTPVEIRPGNLSYGMSFLKKILSSHQHGGLTDTLKAQGALLANDRRKSARSQLK